MAEKTCRGDARMFPKFYPQSKSFLGPLASSGLIPGLAPRGVVVHFTGGSSLQGAYSTLKKKGYAYHLLIDRDGRVSQCLELVRRAAHAGHAEWEGLSPNRYFIGISLVGWGQLVEKNGKFLSEAATEVPADQVALRVGHVDDKLRYWQMSTPAQDKALLEALRWLMEQGIPAAMVCGHDECALPKGRKDDPGGMLPWTMPELREMLRDLHLNPQKG